MKTTKKEIRKVVEDAMLVALTKLKISAPSKKIRKGLIKMTKELAHVLKEETKRSSKRTKSVTDSTKRKRKKSPDGKGKKPNTSKIKKDNS